jgi:mersacidin/lichenicidin family type 2 lantibiotic
MGIEDIARAWKDAEYRENLSKEHLARLPESPIGEVELSEEDLKGAAGGTSWASVIISIVSAASVAACTSLFSGGTCHLDSAGCC